MKSITPFIAKIKNQPEHIEFDDVIAAINANYTYTPTLFTNGIGEHKIVNEVGKNEGSCRIFYFAKLHNLDKEQTLSCFGQFYRNDVLKKPLGSDHANIRKFIEYGWMGICFDGIALEEKISE